MPIKKFKNFILLVCFFSFWLLISGLAPVLALNLAPSEITKDQIKQYVPNLPDKVTKDQLDEFNKMSPIKITEEQMGAYNENSSIKLTDEQKVHLNKTITDYLSGKGAPKEGTSEPAKIDLNYPWSGEKSPAGLVARFYQIALGLAGAAALGVLIYGAILWTVSGAVTGKQDALEWIKGALWGLVLLLGAYLILWTINPDLVNLKNPTLPLLPSESTSESATKSTSNWPQSESYQRFRQQEIQSENASQ